MTKYRKKLIEVALPLEAINKESAREKSIRHGHPSTLHLWWARRPLAACRAVLFSSLVNDPEDDPMYGIDKEIAYTERAKLFDLIEELVKWDNSNNPRVINAARLEIARSIAANKVADKELPDDIDLVGEADRLDDERLAKGEQPIRDLLHPQSKIENQKSKIPPYTPHDIRFKMPSLRPEQVNHFLAHYAPPVLDPFAGGGSIPLEAQRLGLRAYASDLNPVPVLINKALIEIPPKFSGMPPVNPKAHKGKLKNKVWSGSEGLADDVRYYGQWMRDEAEKSIGNLYPKVKVTPEMAVGRHDLEPYIGKELTVIAWLWARTVESPNPAAGGAHVPLLKSFWLSTKKGQEAFIQPVVATTSKSFEFRVKSSTPPNGFDPSSGTVVRSGATCLLTGSPLSFEHVRNEAKAGRMKSRLTAIVCQAGRERVFLSPIEEHEEAANRSIPQGYPETSLPEKALSFRVQLYGMDQHYKLFTARQLVLLTTFAQLIERAIDTANRDGATEEYAQGLALYLAFCIDKIATTNTTQAAWQTKPTRLIQAFSRQSLPMIWDYAEANPFSNAAGDYLLAIDSLTRVIEHSCDGIVGSVSQQDATKSCLSGHVVSTDPPYYDNIGYADLSDYYYVWLRLSLRRFFPDLFSTLLTPKDTELIATPFRHGESKRAARDFFERGLGHAIQNIYANSDPSSPVSIFYAFKQSESDAEGVASTGWETMLEGVIKCGFTITGTWPMRTELTGNLKNKISALAASIVLACRKRHADASIATRRDFATALRKELPEAIKHLQSGNVAPVDLAQASIGPGMAVFSRYKQVVNADGSPMSVREALQMINQMLDESLNEQEADFDSESRFAVRWFEQYGMTDGPFGDAETLAKAMAVAVSGVVEAGILASKSGKVRLLKREELDANWNPQTDRRSTIWECTQHLIRRLEADGESAAAELLVDIQQAKGSEAGEVARELSYRLYSTCERKSWAAEARSYNGLVVSWTEVSRLARQLKKAGPRATQQNMF